MVTFYSRPNCSLCEHGLAILKLVQEEIPFVINEVNIENDEILHEKYLMMIPVVEQNGQVIQFGILDYEVLLSDLQAEK